MIPFGRKYARNASPLSLSFSNRLTPASLVLCLTDSIHSHGEGCRLRRRRTGKRSTFEIMDSQDGIENGGSAMH